MSHQKNLYFTKNMHITQKWDAEIQIQVQITHTTYRFIVRVLTYPYTITLIPVWIQSCVDNFENILGSEDELYLTGITYLHINLPIFTQNIFLKDSVKVFNQKKKIVNVVCKYTVCEFSSQWWYFIEKNTGNLLF